MKFLCSGKIIPFEGLLLKEHAHPSLTGNRHRICSMFSSSELQSLIAGGFTVDVVEMKQHAKYSGGYNKDCEEIR